MIGITDPWILLAYLLCVASAIICIVYGVKNWNKGAENEPIEIEEEQQWQIEETKIEENL
jgi:hypothetical protein